MGPEAAYRKFIASLPEDGISFEQLHVQDRLRHRGLDEKTVAAALRNLRALLSVTEEPAQEKEERKFRARYRLSSHYDLEVIAVFRGTRAFVVTLWKLDKKYVNIFKKY